MDGRVRPGTLRLLLTSEGLGKGLHLLDEARLEGRKGWKVPILPEVAAPVPAKLTPSLRIEHCISLPGEGRPHDAVHLGALSVVE